MSAKRLMFLLPVVLLCACEARMASLAPPTIGTASDLRSRPRNPQEIRQDIRNVLESRLPVKENGTLGVVYLAPEARDGKGQMHPAVMSLTEENVWQGLRDGYLFGNVINLSNFSHSASTTRDLLTLRYYAAQAGCHYLLVYALAFDYTRQTNPLSILYLTIIGAFIVPGEVIVAQSAGSAVLMDVETGFIYGDVQGRAQRSMAMPIGWIASSLPRLYELAAEGVVQDMRTRMNPILDRMREQLEIIDGMSF